jgi:hypothetical protein
MREDDLKRPSCGPAPLGSNRKSFSAGKAIVLFLVSLPSACSKGGDEAAAQATQEPAAKTPPIAAPLTASVVRSSKDGFLEECDDFTTIRHQVAPGEANAETGFVDGLVGGFLKRNPGTSRLDKPCGDLFRAVPAVATCTTHISSYLTKGDSSAQLGTYDIQMTSRYYDPNAVTSDDSYEKGCVEMKGDWQAVDKNSNEYKAAVRARAARKQ